MKKRLLKITILLSVYFACIIAGQAQHMGFSYLGLDEGLSQISVNALYQDEFGRIWIGTRNGLNLYDGNKIKTFFPVRGDTIGLQHSLIGQITGDHKGNIYIKSQGTLSHFLLETEKFRTILYKDVMAISNAGNSLLVSTRKELLRFSDSAANVDTLYRYSKQITCTDLHEDARQNIWMATEEGIYRLDKDLKLHVMVPQVKTTHIFEDSDRNIWIGTWEDGAYIYDQQLKMSNLRSNVLSSNFVRDICEDNNGNFWIGTFNGVDLYNPRKKAVVAFYPGKEKGGPLPHSSVWSLIKDEQGSIWMGTYFGGVCHFNPEYDFYHYYQPEEGNAHALSSPIVGKMIEDNENRLWICTEGGGLNCLNRKTRQFKSYRHQPSNPNSISHDNIKSIWFDEEKDLLWIGTHTGGLNRFDIKTETFRAYRHNKNDPHSIPGDIVKDIMPYKDKLILATYNGVCMFDPKTGKATRMFAKEKYGYSIVTAICLFFDADDKLWISVGGEGVFSYDFETDELKNYRYESSDPHSINSLLVNCIFQDHKFRLWFGNAENGLNMYRPETDDFISFSKQNSGILSNHISSILESRYGYLLIATGQGFSRLDVDRTRFYNYTRASGFPLSTVNDGAAFITKDGEVFFGGVTGLVSFFEKELNKSSKPFFINFEQLMVNNQDIQPDDGTKILTKSILTADKIELNHKHTVFSIRFATSNFIPANRKQLEYRLVGFGDEWLNVDAQNIFTYTNLNPGKYTFEIREKNPENPGQRAYHSIAIIIKPPVYMTWYAILFYIALGALLGWWLLRYYQTEASLKLEKKEKMQLEDLNQNKFRFFTNISHEFRTPVSLIIGQTEMLLQTPDLHPSAYDKALSIYKNSRKMNELISELIDFRKQEQGFMKLRVKKKDIVAFLYELYINFKSVADHKKRILSFNTSQDKIELWFDSVQMQKVFNNLLSNAFKYTPQGGSIQISVAATTDQAVIYIKDTGMGIPETSLEKIFDRFYQEDNQGEAAQTNPGSGIGLALAKGIVELHKGSICVESMEGEGSTFIITLPLDYTFVENEVTIESEEAQTADFSEKILLGKDNDSETVDKPKGTAEVHDSKIFIVEDNNELREMLIRIFSPLYDVCSASNGESAFEEIKSWQPDIVLSDVMMPGMSGTDLCAHIKSDFDTSHIPVVLLTALTSIEHNLEGLKIGADDYITKPFNVRILVARCNNLINTRRMLQDKFTSNPTFSAKIIATNAIDKEAIEKAQNIVEKHIDDSRFDVSVFAREMALGRTNLFSKIKGITGQTPNEFIQTIKLKKAAFWLKNNPELSIADITYSLGFSSPRYFSKCFKDAFGVAPIYFRRREDNADREEEE